MPTHNPLEFNAYHKWLGIPTTEQPPHFYRLLGIELFESDNEVIAAAADRQMAHIKSFAAGQFASASQELLNELARARVTLLNTDQRTSYDRMLRQIIAAKKTGSPPAPRGNVANARTASATDTASGHSLASQVDVSIGSPMRIARRQRSDSTTQLLLVLFASFGVAIALYFAASTAPPAQSDQANGVTPNVDRPSPPVVATQEREPRRPRLEGSPSQGKAIDHEVAPVQPPIAVPPPDTDSEPKRPDIEAKDRVQRKSDFVKLDLGRRTQRTILDGKSPGDLQVISVRDCDLPWKIKPQDGTLNEKNSVTIEIAGTRKVEIEISKETGARDETLLVVEGTIETDAGKPLPLTLANVERVRRNVVKQGERATVTLAALEGERNQLTSWLSSSALKPLSQVGPAKDRIRELANLISQQAQYVETLRADLEVAEKVCSLAKHLHEECAVEITTIVEE